MITTTKATRKITLKETLEAAIGARLIRGWHLDGAGPARFGWASMRPCRDRYEGRTLAEIAARLADGVDEELAQARDRYDTKPNSWTPVLLRTGAKLSRDARGRWGVYGYAADGRDVLPYRGKVAVYPANG